MSPVDLYITKSRIESDKKREKEQERARKNENIRMEHNFKIEMAQERKRQMDYIREMEEENETDVEREERLNYEEEERLKEKERLHNIHLERAEKTRLKKIRIAEEIERYGHQLEGDDKELYDKEEEINANHIEGTYKHNFKMKEHHCSKCLYSTDDLYFNEQYECWNLIPGLIFSPYTDDELKSSRLKRIIYKLLSYKRFFYSFLEYRY